MKTHDQMTNQEVSHLLEAVKAVLELEGASRFRIMAYDRASESIQHLTTELKDLWEADKLDSVPGIGENLEKYLSELFETGRVTHFEKLFSKVKPAFFELLKLNGVGAKTAWKLTEKLGISQASNALKRLEKACRAGKVQKLAGFGPESEANLLESIAQLKKKPVKRILLAQAQEVADRVTSYLTQIPEVKKVDPLGSLRRRVATVGDLDLAVPTNQAQKVISHFVAYPETQRVLAQGENTARIVLKNGFQVDLKTQTPEKYGALLQHFTGSKQHNIHLRELALKKGLSLSEYGIKRKGKLMEFSSEEDFYEELELDWIPPELREDQGEIEAARRSELPRLVKLKNLRGDLHLHSDFAIEPSHDLGQDKVESLVNEAVEREYQYLVLTEHNPSQKHSPQEMVNLLKRKANWVKKKAVLATGRGVRLVNGLEVDILPDGHLPLPDSAFSQLGFVIVSVHSSFRMDKEVMTKRILRALEYPKVCLLGHPTGRMIQKREAYEADWKKIFLACKRKKIALEVNSCPTRLDLPEELIRMAVEMRVKLAICSDAHRVSEMETIRYGVDQARRGWAEKEDIVNTMKYNEFINWVKKH